MKSVSWDLDFRSLVRRTVPASGSPYEHRVRFAEFKHLAYALQDMPPGFTVFSLAEAAYGCNPETGVPLYTTRAHIVIDFALECSLVEKCVGGNALCPGFDPLVLIADMYGYKDRVYPDAG